MKRIRRLIELDTRAVMWLLDLLGAWRTSLAVIGCLGDRFGSRPDLPIRGASWIGSIR
jgi:hypothetical protein